MGQAVTKFTGRDADSDPALMLPMLVNLHDKTGLMVAANRC